jgi:hypothetical protein
VFKNNENDKEEKKGSNHSSSSSKNNKDKSDKDIIGERMSFRGVGIKEHSQQLTDNSKLSMQEMNSAKGKIKHKS